MDHQDWEPVILKKSVKKTYTQHQPGHKRKNNLNSDDPDAPKTLGLSAGKQIQQARLNRKLTQKQLAQQINVKLVIIQGYETGQQIPDRNVLNKLNRILKIKT